MLALCGTRACRCKYSDKRVRRQVAGVERYKGRGSDRQTQRQRETTDWNAPFLGRRWIESQASETASVETVFCLEATTTTKGTTTDGVGTVLRDDYIFAWHGIKTDQRGKHQYSGRRQGFIKDAWDCSLCKMLVLVNI